MNPDDRLGLVIGQLREKAGLSRRDLAVQVAHTSGQDYYAVSMQLSRWEAGKVRTPDMNIAVHMLHALGYDLALIPREDT